MKEGDGGFFEIFYITIYERSGWRDDCFFEIFYITIYERRMIVVSLKYPIQLFMKEG
jgi:hypothetical protein